MEQYKLSINRYIAPTSLGIFVLISLYLASIYNYLLFHSLVELFSVIVACAIFVVTWNTRRIIDNYYLLFIGISYLFVAGIDLLHTLAYKGMGVFPSFDANLPTQLWIIARYMESISLFIAPFFIRRKFKSWPVFAAYALIGSLLLFTVFHWNIFPVCYVEGQGLTAFKIINEYMISLILLGTLVLLFINRQAFECFALGCLMISIVLTICSELAFTAYVSVYGFANMLGHILKLLSFCFIYEAIVVMGLQKSHNLFYRELKQQEKHILDLNIQLEDKIRERTAQLEISHESLRQSEENFRHSLDDSPLGVRIVTEDGETIYANRAILDIYGYNSIDELKAIPVMKRYTPDSFAEFQIRREKRRGGKIGPHEYEISIIRKDGAVRNLQVFRKDVLWDGERQYQITYQDITDRKRAEVALRESEERLRTIVEASLDAIIAVNVEGKLVLFNGAAQELFQYSEEEALNQPVDLLLREEICKIHQERLERFLKRGVGRCGHIGRRTEKLFRRKDGALFEAEVSMSGGRLNGLRLVVLAIHDITSRKKTEETLRESESRYRELFDNISSGVAIYEATNNGNDFIFKDLNRTGERLDGNRKEDIIGKSIYQVRPGINEYGLTEVFKRVWATGMPEHYPGKFYQDERLQGWYDNFVYRLPSGEIVAVYDDITERKQAEEELHASLREKEILLREVHHRVKNNMQVISGLLDLHASSSGNPELTEMCRESQDQIRSMALVHEKLYASKDFTRIDLVGYVKALSQELFQVYSINSRKIDLIIQTDGTVYVNIDKAVPCGLILNELISNALKHAFPGDEPGELRIIINKTKNTEIEIVVRDNGRGLPDDVDPHKPQTAGLHLVNGLIQNQLGGQIKVRRNNGTEFRIKFPL